MPFIKKRKARFVLYNLAFLFLFLFIAEVFLRLTGIGYDNAAFEPDSVLHHVHRKNYSFVNDNPAENEYSNIDVYYDSWGCVANPSKESVFNPSDIRIALMGDSYIEGLQVPFNSSITGLLQKELNHTYEVKNFAVGGYSPVIYYLQLPKIISLYHPQKILLFLYSNDAREDVEYLQNATYSNHHLTGINGGLTPLRYMIIRNSYLLRLIRKFYMQAVYYFNKGSAVQSYPVKNILEEKPVLSLPTTSYLDSIIDLCYQNKCELILSAIPSRYKITNHIAHDSTDFAVQCRQWAFQKNIKFIDLIAAFETGYAQTNESPFFTKDIHFNALGHSLLAKEVTNYAREN